MTDERTPIEPNDRDPDEGGPVDSLDQRLSAELDGVATPASEQGDDARADARRLELTAARDLLAIPPPPLDDVTRRRLLRTALASAPPARRRHDPSWLRRAGVAAAVLAVVAAGGVTLKAVSDSDSDSMFTAGRSGDNASSGTTTAPSGGTANLRELSDPQVLRQRVTSGDLPPATTTAGPKKSEAAPTGNTDTSAFAVQVGDCEARVSVPAGAKPTVLGEGTYDGAPAVVLFARDGARTLVFVVGKADCRLLTSQFFGE